MNPIYLFLAIFSQLKYSFAVEQSERLHIARSLSKNGFHRGLETQLNFTFSKSELERIKIRSCKVLLLETLPSGAYVDFFEVKFQFLRSDMKVYMKEESDVEAPEWLSTSMEVHVFRNITSDSISVELPIHARYHRPSNVTTHAKIVIDRPKIYTNCSFIADKEPEVIKAPCSTININSICNWYNIQYSQDQPYLEFTIPVGQTQHAYLVLFGTLATTLLCTLWMMIKIIRKPPVIQRHFLNDEQIEEEQGNKDEKEIKKKAKKKQKKNK